MQERRGKDAPELAPGHQKIRHKAWILAHPEAGADGPALHLVGPRPGGNLFALLLLNGLRRFIWSRRRSEAGRLACVAPGVYRLNRGETVLEGSAKREARGPRARKARIVIQIGR